MVKSHIVYALAGLLAVGVFAQSPKEPVEDLKVESTEAVRSVDIQQRRAALRAMLKSQPDGAATREATTTAQTVRQLSPQERADLREQLRQQ